MSRQNGALTSRQSPSDAPTGPLKTIAVVGGGMTGALFGLKMSQARPDVRVVVIERGRRFGRGVAYGACSPHHLLNVPVHRMEVGLTPSFTAWLQAWPPAAAALADALEESGGDLQSAFVPRSLFGDYLEAQVARGASVAPGPGLVLVRGEAVRLFAAPRRGVRLADGREIEADVVVLATGNFPPATPGGPDTWLYDSPVFVADPWSPDAFDDIGPDDPLLLIGTGLTMVDIALKLESLGHRGAILAISRRGLTPGVHRGGGAWPAFLESALPASPRQLTGLIRNEIASARSADVTWQRVFDAARPAVAAVWRAWTPRQKRQFLRHLRTRWDVHRHRMAPRIHSALKNLAESGRLQIQAARILGYRPARNRVEAILKLRDGTVRPFTAARVVNCTGPRRDLRVQGIPLLSDLFDRGLAQADDLGLGLETQNGALLDRAGRRSDWLFALGPLTCPSWWEITAVPEIVVQVDSLIAQLAADQADDPVDHDLSASDFLDLGAGI